MMQRASRSLRFTLGAALAATLAPMASAQWVNFHQDDNRIKRSDGVTVHTTILNDTREKDYATADLDEDGLQDLVIVRKQPVSFTGAFRGYLLLQAPNGDLVDRTDTFAAESDTDPPATQGLLRPTDSRDVEIGDLNGDGDLDMVTTQTDLTNVEIKELSHPRVYVNKGFGGGVWAGLRHENGRIPQLKTVGGLNGAVRFCDNALGDYDNDGDLDLYFVDYDTDENGHGEPSNLDLNDRLLENDGNAFFTDVTTSKMTLAMYGSAFGTEVQFVDLNGDSKLDVFKITTLTNGPRDQITYNDATPGGATQFDLVQNLAQAQPYVFDVGDLNNDGRIDQFTGDDNATGSNADHYQFNLGNDGLNQVQWSSKKFPTYTNGANAQGFPGQTYMVDFDLDGWLDIIVTDVDIDLLGCTRDTHILHSLGGTPGSQNIPLQAVGFGVGGWATTYVGSHPQSGAGGYPEGVFDAGIIDLDNDGDQDIILGMCAGTDVWVNDTAVPEVCQPVVGQGNLGTSTLTVCGDVLSTGNTATLSITGPANGQAVLMLSLTQGGPFNAYGGQIHTIPLLLSFVFPLGPTGQLNIPVPGGNGPLDIYVQAMTVPLGKPVPTSITDAVKIQFLP